MPGVSFIFYAGIPLSSEIYAEKPRFYLNQQQLNIVIMSCLIASLRLLVNCILQHVLFFSGKQATK